jgi:uncharacterized protein YecT (DUF1311 family)
MSCSKRHIHTLVLANVFFTVFSVAIFAQDNTLEGLGAKIRIRIDSEIPSFKKKMLALDYSVAEIEFAIDTFRVERIMEETLKYDQTDFGMSEVGYYTARLYDSLLNKYYKILLAVLEEKDRKTLVSAQKSWLKFRDDEISLIELIGAEKYAGGGTLQALVLSSEYLRIVKSRTIEIFEHYKRAAEKD